MATVLIVDDDPDLQGLWALVLSREGHTVHQAETGHDGYDETVALLPDIVLLDLMLPGMNGLEVLKRLKLNPDTRDIPVAVMTAFPDEAAFVESSVRGLGAVEYLRKPIRVREMVAAVNTILLSRGRLPARGLGAAAATQPAAAVPPPAA
jgi:DNA-binding response OmpR family regulator